MGKSHLKMWALFLIYAPAVILTTLYILYIAMSGNWFWWDQLRISLFLCIIFMISSSIHILLGGDKWLILKRLFGVLFAFYLFLLLDITFIDATMERSREEYDINLIPFHTIALYIQAISHHYLNKSIIFLNLGGNILLLTPTALFFPIFIKPLRHWYFYVPCIILMTCIIEGAQFALLRGTCDIDDIILNVIGSIIAFAIFKIPVLNQFVRNLSDYKNPQKQKEG